LRGTCAGITRSGLRCTQSVEAGLQFCHHHDPARADERRRAASRAGKSRTPHMVRELHETLAQVTEDVIGGQLTPYAGMSVAQLINARIKLLEFERAEREQIEVVERLERLEERRTGSWAR
jgi:hypothetical protein